MKKVGIALIAIVALLLLIQLVPYGRNHTNPAVVKDYAWPSPEAEQIARRACYDCHSNETIWYWYTGIAPFSWLVQRDVDEGRRKLNFSDYHPDERTLDELGEVIEEGSMPPLQYTLIHPNAKLSEPEKQVLITSLSR